MTLCRWASTCLRFERSECLNFEVKQFVIAEVLVSVGDDSRVLLNVRNYSLVGERMVWNEWKLYTWNTICGGLTTAK